MESACQNCGVERLGAYCHGCGQAFIGDEGRRIRPLLNSFAVELTSLDGRFWRSALGLLRPGWLSQQYLLGRRASLLSPVSIFLLVNVLYFFAPALNDFELPFSDQISGALYVQYDGGLTAAQRVRIASAPGQLHSRWTTPWIESRLASRQVADPQYSLKTLAADYDAKSVDISKLLIIVHAPFLALVLLLLFHAGQLYYAEHFVVSLHLFAGILLLMQLIVPIIDLLAALRAMPVQVLGWLMPTVMLGYLCAAFIRVYRSRWWYALLAAVGFLGGLLLVNLVIYRTIQFVVVFAMI